ncbi:MAG: hypothetical protein H6669_01430 [Ardenticatenaceae bacterium]|nr:hypothetical protein [Ardenticatenaceae bacterium]
MQKWEYLSMVHVDKLVINGDIVAEAPPKGLFGGGKKLPSVISVLNDLGDQGWELVATNGGYFYFKRPKNQAV